MGVTRANPDSSRSHCILQLQLRDGTTTRASAARASGAAGLPFEGLDAVSYTHLTLPTNREV